MHGSELNQVWTNLLVERAGRAGRQGHDHDRHPPAGPRIAVDIEDDGPGIPAEIQSKIFEPFFTTKGVGKGTGLGLDIARRIVVGHRGNISVKSQPGQTRFTVMLPTG